ncbi:hypothetical protein [Actinoplanes sp. M2I2]|uniref:hypothetical protein n=1 Tax=Actinoplanes sp. M2I2 TaxID=1734444 RepID=UPI0020218AC9|nr:hypothetical protein [Actinoplanes sp. M2I2]
MRTRTIIGLAVAGGAAAVAVGFGGTALAAGSETGTHPAVQVTVDNGRAVTPGSDTGAGSATQWDCPEKDGSAGPGGASPGAQSPDTQPPAASL